MVKYNFQTHKEHAYLLVQNFLFGPTPQMLQCVNFKWTASYSRIQDLHPALSSVGFGLNSPEFSSSIMLRKYPTGQLRTHLEFLTSMYYVPPPPIWSKKFINPPSPSSCSFTTKKDLFTQECIFIVPIWVQIWEHVVN